LQFVKDMVFYMQVTFVLDVKDMQQCTKRIKQKFQSDKKEGMDTAMVMTLITIGGITIFVWLIMIIVT